MRRRRSIMLPYSPTTSESCSTPPRTFRIESSDTAPTMFRVRSWSRSRTRGSPRARARAHGLHRSISRFCSTPSLATDAFTTLWITIAGGSTRPAPTTAAVARSGRSGTASPTRPRRAGGAFARRLLDRALPSLESLEYIRSRAYAAMLGLAQAYAALARARSMASALRLPGRRSSSPPYQENGNPRVALVRRGHDVR